MSIWSAPDVEYLLEEHLRLARTELMADHRLRVNVEGNEGEDPAFVAELIVDKLEAAARAGFDAVEASLRVSASEHLTDRGLGVLQVRSSVATACERLVPPKRPRLEKVEMGVVPPALVGGLLAASGTVAAFTAWVMFGLGDALYLGLIAASLGLGFGIYRGLQRKAARRRVELIDQWPARVCRHYLRALHEATSYYEHVVRTVARGGVLIPWR